MATADQLRQERDLTAIRNQLAMAESRLLEAKKSTAPPIPKVIEKGVPAVWHDGAWYSYFPITTSLKEIWWGNRCLPIPPKDQHPFTVGLGLYVGEGKVGGEYSLGSVRILHPQNFYLPHIDNYGGCLRVDVGAPKKLLTMEDYWALHAVLMRHCEGVQLNSLYTGQSGWLPEILRSLPPEVMEYLESVEDSPGPRRRMLEIFPNNGGEVFEVEADELDHCECVDCRRARGELVPEEASEVEVPNGEMPPPEAGDVWEVEEA